MAQPSSRIRFSISTLQNLYDSGNTAPLEAVVRAFYTLQRTDPNDESSYFWTGGLHGQPFILRPKDDKQYWGGYCHHGNVLFPTWHRAQLWHIEESMRKIPGCENVTIPFLDATHPDVLKNGLPRCITDEEFVFKDGTKVKNPLKSYVFQVAVKDDLPNWENMDDNPNNDDKPDFSKHVGYATTRFPMSGLVGTPEDKAESDKYNQQFIDNPQRAADLLNENFVKWMFGGNPTQADDDETIVANFEPDSVAVKFLECLMAPNYTLFSNKNSQEFYNKQQNKESVRSLEDAHNDVHLAIGGKPFPNMDLDDEEEEEIYSKSNGDMAVNNTAGFDPVFFLHHCNVDRVFWLWQKRTGRTTDLGEIDHSLEGTKTTDNDDVVPPVGVEFDEQLTLDTPLLPFKDPKQNPNGPTPYMTSRTMTDIRALGYTYGYGSLDFAAFLPDANILRKDAETEKLLHIYDISRRRFNGAFALFVFVKVDKHWKRVGIDSTLNGSKPEKCKNCMTYDNRGPSFPLTPEMVEEYERSGDLQVKVIATGNHGKRGVRKKLKNHEFKWKVIP